MTEARIRIFERPFGDLILCRWLEYFVGRQRALAAMTKPSRFMVLLPPTGPDVHCIACANLEEVLGAVRALRTTLTDAGVRHIYLERLALPETERLIDVGANAIEREVRPPAANDPE